jgi:hypothetical protein
MLRLSVCSTQINGVKSEKFTRHQTRPGGGEDGMLLALSRSVEMAIKEKLSE